MKKPLCYSSAMINVGIGQIDNTTSFDVNMSNIMSCLERFSRTKANLIVFPECSLSGFSANIQEATEQALAPFLERIHEWSLQYEKAVILPTAYKVENEIYNSGFFFNKKSREQFYKVGLTESEKNFFSTPPNYKKQIFEVNGQKFIPLICLEAELEPNLYFEKAKVDFIIWPGYWGWDIEDKWKNNKVYQNNKIWGRPILQANFAKNDLEDKRTSGPHGLSAIINSDNTVSFQGAYERQECILISLEGKEIKQVYSLTP